MPIHDQGYRRYAGERSAHGRAYATRRRRDTGFLPRPRRLRAGVLRANGRGPEQRSATRARGHLAAACVNPWRSHGRGAAVLQVLCSFARPESARADSDLAHYRRLAEPGNTISVMESERSLEQRLADVEALLKTILVRLDEVEVRAPAREPTAPKPATDVPAPPPPQPAGLPRSRR